MTDKDFRTTLKIFDVAKAGIRNDESLGEYLMDLGAALLHLGVQEISRAREATR
jgi:hypothetical protein